MSDGTTTKPVQVCEGRWRTRSGEIRNVTPTPEGDGRKDRFPWWDAAYKGTWTSDGRYLFGEASPLDLFEYIGPLEEDKTQELPAEYTPPEGWCVLAVGEVLREGDVWVNQKGESRPTKRIGETVRDERYIRPIESQPQPQPEPVQVREGRWLKRSGVEVSVSAMPMDHDDFTAAFPWWDGQETTWTHSGHLLSSGECPADLVKYLGPIEPQPEPQPPMLQDKTPSESEPPLPEAVITRLATTHSQLEEAADEISRLRGRLDNAEWLLEQRSVQVDYRPRTYFIDIDGTLVQHAMKGQADNVTTSKLPGAKDFIDRLLAAGHRVILTTGRRSVLRLETEQQLSDAKIAYDELIMDLPPGIRIVVNDAKPDVPVTAYGITVPRNQGCLDIVRWEEHTLPGKAHAKVQGADAP